MTGLAKSAQGRLFYDWSRKSLTINEFIFTLCVSSRRHEVNDIARCIGAKPTRVSEASEARDHHRVFWDFGHSWDESFDDACPRAIAWAGVCADLLSRIDDAAVTLWCEVHSDSEFAGLALQGEQLMDLGARKISLVLSVYAKPDASQATSQAASWK